LKAGYMLSRLGRVLILSGEGPALICSRSLGHTPSPSGANDTDSPAGRHPKTETERLLERHNGSKSPSIVSTRGNKTKP
jgi:hypothetical protein